MNVGFQNALALAMSYNLFLDDLRNPVDAYLYDEKTSLFEATFKLDWVTVRDYDSFVQCITERGLPDIVSFDHDLHFEHVRHYAEHTIGTGYIEYEIFKHKTGKHAAEFLVNFVKQTNNLMPVCFVHSANDHGRRNIKQVLSR